jgi:hypothetical protein
MRNLNKYTAILSADTDVNPFSKVTDIVMAVKTVIL